MIGAIALDRREGRDDGFAETFGTLAPFGKRVTPCARLKACLAIADPRIVRPWLFATMAKAEVWSPFSRVGASSARAMRRFRFGG